MCIIIQKKQQSIFQYALETHKDSTEKESRNKMKKGLLTFLCAIAVGAAAFGYRKELPSSVQAQAGVTVTPTVSGTDAPKEEADKIESPITIDTGVPIEKGARIAVVVKSVSTGYWKDFQANMEKAVDYLNQAYGYTGEDKITMTYEGPKEESDVTTQINTIDAVLAENPSVLCLAASDADSCEAQLETARENGIPVIMFDSNVSSNLVNVFCGTNNTKAGAAAADKLCRVIGNEGEVAVVAHENAGQTSKDRVRGFRRRIQNKHPNMTLSSITFKNGEEKLEDMVRNVVETYRNLKGIFCTNPETAETVLNILKEYPDREIQIVGFDSGSIQKKAVLEGIEYGVIAQDTYRMAFETIWAAARSTAWDEEEIQNTQEKIYVKHVWVNQKNLEKNKTYLYD